jgi:hypothetical protein
MTSDAAAVLAASRLLLASLAVAVIPGTLVVLAWRPRRDLTLLELVALGIASSLILMQALTVAALVFHQPVSVMLIVLGLVALGHSVAAARGGGVVIQFPRGEWILGAAIVAITVCLYLVGSPYGSTEDAIHIAIVRRLRFLDTPALDNIYVVPRVVYTYPFPGTHYLMAAISRLADLDPLFVYHKLRALWGFAALTLLYACARCVFESQRMALASALVAVALVANGSFAGVPNFYWGQLAPYSHASDVAMGVMLPALLLLALHVFRATSPRDTAFFFVATGGLVVMLTMVHIREVVQFATYLAAFLVALLIVRRDSRVAEAHGRPSGVGPGDSADLQRLASIDCARHRSSGSGQSAWLSSRLPARCLFATGCGRVSPWSADSFPRSMRSSTAGIQSSSWVRRASWFAGGCTRTMLMVGASILAFALVLRIGALTWAYVYATYFEVLYTPVRNVIFFVHLLGRRAALCGRRADRATIDRRVGRPIRRDGGRDGLGIPISGCADGSQPRCPLDSSSPGLCGCGMVAAPSGGRALRGGIARG